MATDEVIANLVRDLRPVRPLPVPQVRLVQWGLVAVTTMVIVTAGLGPRANLLDSLATVPFHAHSILLGLVALSSAIAALAMAIPGEPVQPWRRWAPVVAGLSWAAVLLGELWVFAVRGQSSWPGMEGVGCVAKAFAFSVTPGLALMLMIGRSAPGDVRATMFFAGLAATAVGALGVELTCPLTSPSHLVVWHAAPVAAVVIAAYGFGRVVFGAFTRVRLPRS